MADKEKKDKKDEVIIGDGLEDIVSTGAGKDKDKDKDKPDKPDKPVEDKDWKSKVKKGVPIKFMVFKLKNKKTGEYVIDVELYDPDSKGKTDFIPKEKRRGKAKKDWEYEVISAKATEKEAYDKITEYITENNVLEDEKSPINTIPTIPPKKKRSNHYNTVSFVNSSITIDGVEYNSVREAALVLGKPLGILLKELRDK